MGLVVLAGCDDPVGQALLDDLRAHPELRVEAHVSLEVATHAAIHGAASVLVACTAVPPKEALSAAATVAESGVDTAVLLVANEVTTELLRAAIKTGVRDVLTTSDGPKVIVSSVLAADRTVEKRRTPEEPAPVPEVPARSSGKVITVFSTKGGVGKSVLATNLGVALAGQLGRKTVIADLDLQFGDVSVMLQVPPERTIYDAVQTFDRLDAEMLSGFLVHHDSGLSALLAPRQPEEAESVTSARIAHIITMLRQLADFVVVDTPASLSEVVLTALEQSDVILAVATMDVPSVKNTRVSLQKLRQLGFDGNVIKLVLNRADSKVWLEPAEIEKAIVDRIVARIPSDRLVPRSVNRGVPVVLDAPRSAVARSMVGLAKQIASS